MLFLQFKTAPVGGMEEEKCGKRDDSCLTYRKKGRFCGKCASFCLVYRTFRGNTVCSGSADRPHITHLTIGNGGDQSQDGDSFVRQEDAAWSAS